MPSRRVASDLNAGTYHLTLTLQRWYYAVDRHNLWQILCESLRYCQENKGLKLKGSERFWGLHYFTDRKVMANLA
jgi:putative transposase